MEGLLVYRVALFTCTVLTVGLYTWLIFACSSVLLTDTINLRQSTSQSSEIVPDEEKSVDEISDSLPESGCPGGGEHEAGAWHGVNVREVEQVALQGGPCHPLPGYRNPCWHEYMPQPHQYNFTSCGFCRICQRALEAVMENYTQMSAAGQNWRPRCLPYFYIAGVTKCGTTDLYFSLLSHPHVVKPILKEPNWWTRRRKGYHHRPYGVFQETSLSEYISNFDHAALEIERNIEPGQDGRPWHPSVTMDASTMLFWEDDGWSFNPANSDLQEPWVISAHSLRALQPQARIIIMLRQPSERLYSHYNFLYGKNHSPEDFHMRVTRDVSRMKSCFAEHTVRQCAYNTSLYNQLYETKMFIRASLYSVFMRDWLSVFPRSQILVLRSEDYFSEPQDTINAVSNFLDLPDTTLVKSWEKPRMSRKKDPMLNTTRQYLDEFFRPFNEQLARLLNDSKFLWKS